MDVDGNLSRGELDVVRGLTRIAVNELLEFKSIYELTALQIDGLRENWRAVEAELNHVNRPISGSGVIATLSGDGIEGLYTGEDFLITDELASPETVVQGLGQFPLEAASCAYVFTVLEKFGDDLVEIVNPEFSEERRSWHRAVKAGTRIGGPAKARTLRKAFGEPFRFTGEGINDQPILDLMLIKKERNEFAHRGQMKMGFAGDLL